MIPMISIDNLNSPKKFREKTSTLILQLLEEIRNKYHIEFNMEELGDLILSTCRSNDFYVVKTIGRKKFLDPEMLINWIEKKLIPNTLVINLDDLEVIKLLIFCLEITFRMFEGGTKATITQKGFRERRRTFETILVDQFIGKLGEIMIKKFLERLFPVNIELDWEISKEIEKYKNDIINAEKYVSIKTSPALSGIWAEADIGYDYGIMVKCSIPSGPILQFFIEVCGFSRLLDFAYERLTSYNDLFKFYLDNLKERIRSYKCGEIKTSLKGFICGYFKTSDYEPVEEGENLPYLGKVRERRYIVSIKDLKWTIDDWRDFLEDNKILKLKGGN